MFKSADGNDELSPLRGLTAVTGILYGGDYNPEQWPRSVWAEDIALMRAARVNVVTVGVFSWAELEPLPGEFRFSWLDDILRSLGDAGIGVILATPVASPPPWLGHRYPETLPVMDDGTVLSYGSRNQFCPHSHRYRDAAARITEALASRYHDHPAVTMWHVGNEYGQLCYCDEAGRDFRAWLQDRYRSLDALNEAWATTVWSQRYSEWDEVLPPRVAPYHRNPAQLLDFRRFSSAALLDRYRDQRATIRRWDEGRPVTTNFMGFFPHADYREWAREVDVVADDAYPDPESPWAAADSALVNHLNRGLAQGPWMRMEQAASAVSWREHNLTKSPERLLAETVQAIAHGCDGVCFFQWRQARSGPERFHSAMLPIAGTDSDVHRGVMRLGAVLAALHPVVGAPIRASVALVWEWDSWWAATQEAMPTARFDPLAELQRWHRVLWERGVTVDVVAIDDSFEQYEAVLVPSLYLLDEDGAARFDGYVNSGGTLVWGPFGGVADETGRLHVGRAPVLLTSLLGVSSEEWVPLGRDASVVDAEGIRMGAAARLGERARADSATVLAHHAGGPLDGHPAVTRSDHGEGQAWYVGASLDGEGIASVLGMLSDAGVASIGSRAPGAEVVVRGEYLFVMNHGDQPAVVDPDSWVPAIVAAGVSRPDGTLADLITGRVIELGAHAPISLAPWESLVVGPLKSGTL